MNARERQVVQHMVDALYSAKKVVRHLPEPLEPASVFAEVVLAIGEGEALLALDDDYPPTPRNDR